MKYLIQLLILIVVYTIGCGCYPIKFEKDIAFISSGMANSPEYFIKLNGVVCKDVDNQIGFCAKRVRSNQDLIITVPAQEYAYTFDLKCTDTINANARYDIISHFEIGHRIPFSKYEKERVFNCTVDIYPMDREEAVFAFGAFRVMVVRQEYTSLQEPKVEGKNTIFGKYAYRSYIEVDNWQRDLKEITWLPIIAKRVRVESYSMRYAYMGY